MSAIVQREFTNHCQLLHSAMATDFLPLMHVMCRSEEARKVRQRRWVQKLLILNSSMLLEKAPCVLGHPWIVAKVYCIINGTSINAMACQPYWAIVPVN